MRNSYSAFPMHSTAPPAQQTLLESLQTEVTGLRDELRWAAQDVGRLRASQAPAADVDAAARRESGLQTQVDLVERQLSLLRKLTARG